MKIKITYLLILVCVAVFVYTAMQGDDSIYENYGFSQSNFMTRPYVAITSIFLHGSLVHLLSNMLAWLFFGIAVEDELGKWRMLAIFFSGAFAGDLLSLLFYPAGTLSVGASAAIFALMGTGMLVRPMDLSFYPLVLPMPLAFIGLLYALYNAYEFIFAADPTISYLGHFGGLAVGLYFGFKHSGLRKGLMIIIVTLAVMILIPIVWMLISSRL